MDKNIIYYNDSVFFCIFCKCLFKYDNYYKHLKTKKHNYNLKKNKKINYLIEFD